MAAKHPDGCAPVYVNCIFTDSHHPPASFEQVSKTVLDTMQVSNAATLQQLSAEVARDLMQEFEILYRTPQPLTVCIVIGQPVDKGV